MQQEHTIDCVFFKSIDTYPVSPSFFCIVFASLFVFFKKRLCLFVSVPRNMFIFIRNY